MQFLESSKERSELFQEKESVGGGGWVAGRQPVVPVYLLRESSPDSALGEAAKPRPGSQQVSLIEDKA